jgi:hypothetical protein
MFSSTISLIPAAAQGSAYRLGHRGIGLCRIERKPPAGKLGGIQSAKRKVGVGNRRVRATPAITDRSRLRASAIGADGNALHRIDARNRSATRAYLDHFDHWNADRPSAAFQVSVRTGDLENTRPFRFAIGDQTDLRRRPAHIEGQDLVQTGFASNMAGQDRTTCRSRLDQPDRQPLRCLQGGQATARHHQQQRAMEPPRLNRFGQTSQIAGHQRLHIGVRTRRGEPVVFTDLGTDIC